LEPNSFGAATTVQLTCFVVLLQDCCDKCVSDPLCNAYTHEYDPRRGFLCILKGCKSTRGWEYDCATSPGGANNSCAFVHRPNTPGSMASSAITVGSDAQLLNFSLKITTDTTVPMFPAVFMPTGATRAVFFGLHIQMAQNNVSNAFKIFGKQFEIGENVVHQEGLCLWPGYGPKSDATPFQPSVALYMNEAVDGWVHDNEFYWKCSMMDLDVSDRVIFEDNVITMTEPGIPPHGNSISGCKDTTVLRAAASIALEPQKRMLLAVEMEKGSNSERL
jgi:hypothetical protein